MAACGAAERNVFQKQKPRNQLCQHLAWHREPWSRGILAILRKNSIDELTHLPSKSVAISRKKRIFRKSRQKILGKSILRRCEPYYHRNETYRVRKKSQRLFVSFHLKLLCSLTLSTSLPYTISHKQILTSNSTHSM